MSNRRKPANLSLAEITKKATPTERIVPLCLAGSLTSEHRRAVEELEDAREADSEPAKINEVPKTVALAERVHDIEEAMKEQTYDFTFRQLPADEWRALKDQHPTKNPMRETVNVETFRPAAVAASCVDPPEMDDPEKFEAFWKPLSAGQQESLFAGAWGANEETVSVPFSESAFALLLTSKQPSTTAPHEASL